MNTETTVAFEPTAVIAETETPPVVAPAKPYPEWQEHAPRFEAAKNPLRFGIHGKIHLVKELKTLIADLSVIPDHYKTVIQHELENTIKTNAAQVDLHVVDHADGGISIHGHIKPIQLG